jgi:hypothetical protein
MKKILLSNLLVLLSYLAFSQDNSNTKAVTDTNSCYSYYLKEFSKIKTNQPLKDGEHKVIVSIRENDLPIECREGVISTVAGKIVPPLLWKNEKGELVKPHRKLSDNYADYNIVLDNRVIQGKSDTFLTNKNASLVDIFFIELLPESSKPYSKQ